MVLQERKMEKLLHTCPLRENILELVKFFSLSDNTRFQTVSKIIWSIMPEAYSEPSIKDEAFCENS